MSAFIVSDATINKVIGWLNDSERRQYLRPILRTAEIPEHDADWTSKLGASMFTLNVEAVNARYGAGQASEFRPLDYTFEWELAADVQVLKSLSCWLYQCAEGDVPERPLYKAFRKLEGQIARNIVANLPEWEKAEWG
jgi:hypothetical protein